MFLNVNAPLAPEVNVRRREPSTDVKLTFASGTAAPLVSSTTPETLASPSAVGGSPSDFCEKIWSRGFSGRALLLVTRCRPLCWSAASGRVCKAGLAPGIGLPCCWAPTCEPEIINAENNHRVAHNFFKFPPHHWSFPPHRRLKLHFVLDAVVGFRLVRTQSSLC